ncbi:hypothetical protein [Rheinheimera maricola]|uniref:DUF687 domain-containing protein n=1 Tax=Rheinheimera maricola TaxID=2793282 RepID=A0ABS7X4G8_9GAMM|nr:hypothetical protein [Rheinheimera maricola]MBZ9610426.1 DUF687 domain-containing protein [Rheinheimera maricola]
MFKKTTPDKDYVPNKISLGARLANLALAVLLILLGSYGILNEELYLPLGRRAEVTLYGVATYVAMLAFSLGAFYFLLEIVDHYDKRNNEHIYRRLRMIFRGFACMVFVSAIIVNLKYVYQT